MGETDVLTNRYVENPLVFADIFNFYLYGGRQVIQPESLQGMQDAASSFPFRVTEEGRVVSKPVEKVRDAFASATVKTDGDTIFLLLGVENQTQLHYAMPVRNMLYDAIGYADQVENIRKMHRSRKEHGSSAEFLSGFHKGDRLTPVITLVIYWGGEKWDAPRSIHEMLNTKDEMILKYADDYRINLINPKDMDEKEIEKFHTHLSLFRSVFCDGATQILDLRLPSKLFVMFYYK